MTRARPVAERLFNHVEVPQEPWGCWVWRGHLDNGYGAIRIGGAAGKMVKVHRVSYELFAGPIPHGFQIDHLCRNRACINPSHLEAVTPGENARRVPKSAHNQARKTHCIRGHEFSPDNTFIQRGGGRECRTCARASRREWKRTHGQRRTA